MNIEIIGNPVGTSGFSNHVCGLAKALTAQGHTVTISPLYLNPEWKRHTHASIIPLVEAEVQDALDATIVIETPYNVPIALSARPKNCFAYLIWEGDKVSRKIAEIYNDERITGILCPSTHTLQAAEKGGITNPLSVISHGTDKSIFSAQKETKEVFTARDGIFRFLFVGGWSQGENDRKNFAQLARAFVEEFGKDEPVELVAKINMAYATQGWDLSTEMSKLSLGSPEDHAHISFLLQELSPLHLASLYRSADVFVCPTMAEAFGMVFLEALSCGTPVITTSYGGQTDFCKDDNSWLVTQGDMRWAVDHTAMYDETKWFHVDQKALQQALRASYENKKERAQKAAVAADSVSLFDWHLIAKELTALLVPQKEKKND